MAWRIDKQITRGEINNTVRGRVTGRIWLLGGAEPLLLNLVGDCAPDLAGCTLTFENPEPQPCADDCRPFMAQEGYVGDITASQKGKVFDLPLDDALELIRRGEKPEWHWVNNLYLEWFSDANGRVVIQTPEFRLCVSEPLWTMTEEYRASREASNDAYIKASGVDLGDSTNSKGEDAPDDVFLSDEDGEGEEWKRGD